MSVNVNQVYDYDWGLRDDFMGQAQIVLSPGTINREEEELVVSLVEAMVWECNSWTDPELAGIAGYTLFSQPSGGQHSVR